jgi:hypothetical protein
MDEDDEGGSKPGLARLAQPPTMFSTGREMSNSVFRCKYDNFVGEVVGNYMTKEGKTGLVLQQLGTKVVHVYGLQSLEPVQPDLAELIKARFSAMATEARDE